MLKITKVADGEVVQTWKLEGKLLEPWVQEVAQLCACSNQPGRPIALDLSALSYVDAAGTRLLRELLSRGVTLHGCSGFIVELLNKVKA